MTYPIIIKLTKMEESNKKDGAMMIASAIIGLDYKTVIVNDKSYIIEPPTIAKIAGASYWLCDYGEGTTLRDILKCLSKAENLAKALSWLIQENDELSEELAKGSLTEIVDGIEARFSMIEATNFMRLSALQKSARLLVAKPK